jgi:hypothetical protein
MYLPGLGNGSSITATETVACWVHHGALFGRGDADDQDLPETECFRSGVSAGRRERIQAVLVPLAKSILG